MSRLFLTILVTIPLVLAAQLIPKSPNADVSAKPATSSANGGLIALTLRDQNGMLQIFTISTDGGNRRQLTFEGENGRPDWSPDGRKIAFGSIRNGRAWVVVMNADGSNQQLPTEGVAPDWSPDGRQIAFSRPDGGQITQIWVINADGSNIRQITQSNTTKIAPSWSPDGREMVFVMPRNPGSPNDPQPEIGIMNSDGTNERILTTEDRINTDGNGTVCETANDANAPAWSPVDNRIAFWSGIENQYGQIWVINSNGTGSRQLTEDCSHRNSDDPSWSPDGTKILFSTGRSGRNELWVMDADGNNERRISDIDASPFPGRASWQPAITNANGGWESDQRLTRSEAASQTSINFARSIAADENGRVHLAWREEQDGNPEIYYKRSPDGGVSWGPAIRLGLAPGPLESGNPSISTSGNTVHVAWWDARAVPQVPPQIRYKRSLDGGLTWEADRAITNSPGGGFYPSLAVWGNALHIIYVDGRDGHAEVYYTRSLDAGATWSAPVRLSALPYDSYTPTVAVWQSNVYVAWTDTRHFSQLYAKEEEYFRRSTDGGATFEPEQRLTTDPPESPADSWAPSLAARDQYVWITWFDNRDGNFEIYTKRSLDGGVSWSPDTRLTTTAGQSQRPSIALRGQQLFISYWDTDSGNEEIYVLRSDDLGSTWEPPERLTFASGSSSFSSAAAAASGLHVTWTDTRDGNAEVYYKRLPGAPVHVGNGRIAFTRPVNGDPHIFTVASDGTDEKQLTFAGSNEYPAWSKDGTRLAFSSNRSGAFEIWLMSPDGSSPAQITHGAPGVSFVPDWSYDGTRIAYAFGDPGVGHAEVWVMNADGTQPTRLTTTPPNGQFTWSLHPTWEPGDDRIYYASTASGETQMWGMFSNGLGQEQKTYGLGSGYPHANVPEFSRDGKLTFWAGIEGQYGEVWTVRIGSPVGPVRLTQTLDPMNSDDPSWAPDGTKLLFDSNQPSPNGGVNIWSIASDGTVQELLIPGAIGQSSWQPVFNANANVSGRVTSPDGRGLRNAVVSITDSLGVRRTVTTSSFGFYTFDNMRTGETYVIGVSSKRYRFSSRNLIVNDNLANVDFVGLE